jgi:hypothetical protein
MQPFDDISSKSLTFYKQIQKYPLCPICCKKFATLQKLSLHWNRDHPGTFSEWFRFHYPNFCKKCGKQITTRIQDAYKVEFCSLSCKASKEFWTPKREKAIYDWAAKKTGRKNKGRKMPFTEEHREFLRNRIKTEVRAINKANYEKYGSKDKGKKHSIITRMNMSAARIKHYRESWEGNFTRFQQIVRTYLYDLWTKPCLERDNFRCVECDTDRNIAVHHKIAFRVLIQEVLNQYPQLDLTNYDHKMILHDACLHYEPLLDLDNGVTLCIDCHRKVHRGELIAEEAATYNLN